MQPQIDILLSTYNGEPFLEELLHSLEIQTCQDWRLLIRDDGSSDGTLTMIKSFNNQHEEKVRILQKGPNHLGPKKSFELLLANCDADYIMFCDQDDVWLPEKIEKTRNKMLELEQQNPGKPAMVFTDLQVVDEQRNKIANSFWEYMHVYPDHVNNTYKLLINNPVVGCTVMINKAVKSMVLPFPEQAVMHDWWMALKVSKFGKIDYLKEPTLYYRIHENNNIGAASADKKYYLKRMFQVGVVWTQNRDAVQMLKALNIKLSLLKFLYYKTIMSIKKLV